MWRHRTANCVSVCVSKCVCVRTRRVCVWRSDAVVDPGPNPLKHTHSSSKHTQRAQTKSRVWEDVQHVCNVSWRQRRGAHHIPLMCVWVCPLTHYASSLTSSVMDARYEDDRWMKLPFPFPLRQANSALFSCLCSHVHCIINSIL